MDKERSMAVTRRHWLAAVGLAPMMGALVARAQAPSAENAAPRLSGRERIRQHHLPNVELIAHTGARVRFYDDLVKDKKVIINFMYVKCDGICVPVTTNLARVQKLLGARVGRDIFMYSITLKPAEDSAEDLREFAEQHHVGAGWLFLTGSPPDIEHLRRGLGFAYADPAEDADKSNHIGMVRYGVEALTRWAACPGMANPEHIARSILWDLG
jgi:protein SCO1/2